MRRVSGRAFGGLSRSWTRQTRQHSSDKAGSFDSKPLAQTLDSKPEGPIRDVEVQGFVRNVRSMKTARFVHLGDGSTTRPLQAVLPAGETDGLAIGAAVRMKGDWVRSQGGSQSHELHAKSIEVLGPSDAQTFPLQKKYHTPEYLRTLPHLRSRTPFNASLLALRSKMIASVSRYFESQDYVQSHPPLITSSDCEGAGEVFSVNPAAEANMTEAAATEQDAKTKTDDPFFGSTKYLTVSAQLHLEALAQSVGNVWTLSPTFRAEKSDTFRHLSEFYMLEAETSFTRDLDDVMRVVEGMLTTLGGDLVSSAWLQDRMSASKSSPDVLPANQVEQRIRGLAHGPYPRVPYKEAIQLLQDHQHQFAQRAVYGEGLAAEHEKYIADLVGQGKPVFVTHYPRKLKPFYMLPTDLSPTTATGDDLATVDCFDLLVPDLCEIAGGSMREHRYEHLLHAMRQHGLMKTPDGHTGASGQEASTLDWYLELRRWGCPPHGGFGLGFDRLVAYIAGVHSIRDVVAFPRWYGRCHC